MIGVQYLVHAPQSHCTLTVRLQVTSRHGYASGMENLKQPDALRHLRCSDPWQAQVLMSEIFALGLHLAPATARSDQFRVCSLHGF